MRSVIALACCFAVAIADANEAPGGTVLTSIAPLYSIVHALTVEMPVEVRNVPAHPRTLSTQASYFKSRGANHAAVFKAASATVGVQKLWGEDPLYRTARAFNIRIVPIDATTYWSASAEGIAVLSVPGRDESSPYFWLSINNVLRSTDIIAGDLKRLFPAEAPQIEKNREAFRTELLDLRGEYAQLFAKIADTTVLALATEFVYLTSELTLFVDSYRVRQDSDWTDADLTGLREYVKNRGIRVAIHKWQPDSRIAEALKAGGTEVVVLDTGESGTVSAGRLDPGSLVHTLRTNLEVLYQALDDAR